MNWMAFATHFACVMAGGTVGVLAMAVLAAGKDDGELHPVRCAWCREYKQGNCFMVNRARRPLDFCSKGVPNGR